jgi:hypothetical protein
MSKKFNMVTAVCLVYPQFFMAVDRKKLRTMLNESGYDTRLIARVHFEPVSWNSTMVDTRENKVIDRSWFTPWGGCLSCDSNSHEFQDHIKASMNIWGFMFGKDMKTIIRACKEFSNKGEGHNALIASRENMRLSLGATDNREDLTALMDEKLKNVIDKQQYEYYCPFPKDLFIYSDFGPNRSCILHDRSNPVSGTLTVGPFADNGGDMC